MQMRHPCVLLLPLLGFLTAAPATAELTNFVVVRNARYAALQDFAPTSTSNTGQSGALTLPSGWNIAANSRDSLLVVWMHAWGNTNGMVLADGSSWRPNGIVLGFEESMYDSNQLNQSGNEYSLVGPTQHILVTSSTQPGDNVVDAVFSPPTATSAQFITVDGKDYAVMDLTSPSEQNISQCQSHFVEHSLNWKLANDSAATKIALLGPQHRFGADCVVLNSGKSVHTDDLTACRSGVVQMPYVFTGTGWWVARPRDCNWYERVLISRTSVSSEPTWTIQEDGGNMNTFVKGFDMFATLANVHPTETALGCEGVARSVPSGWSIASPTTSNLHQAIQKEAWGSVCLALSDGSSVQVYDANKTCGADQIISFTDSSKGETYYAVKQCSRRIFLHRNKVQDAARYSIGGLVLVLGVTGSEGPLAVIKQGLDAFGVPYTVRLMDSNAQCGYCQTLDLLNNNSPKYSAITVSADRLITNVNGSYVSSLSESQWDELREYMFDYNVRYFSASTDPAARTSTGEDFGLERSHITTATATVAFRNVPGFNFYGLAASTSSAILENGSATVAEQYRSTLISTDNIVTVLATFDGGSDIAVAHIQFENRREEMHVMYTQNENQLHAGILPTLWVPWVTHGLYLGQRRQHLQIVVQHVFENMTLFDGEQYRATPADLSAIHSRFSALNSNLALGSATKPEFGFHGAFAETSGTDPLYNYLSQPSIRSNFFWVNQMFSGVTPWVDLDLTGKHFELSYNLQFAESSLFADVSDTKPGYSKSVMITVPKFGDLGLVGIAGWDVADTYGISAALGSNYDDLYKPDGSPYRGRVTTSDKHAVAGKFIIPRFSSGIYDEASNPDQLQEEHLSLTSVNATASEIIAKSVNDLFLVMWAHYRHDVITSGQSALRLFGDGSTSLLSMWLDAFESLYTKHFNLPLLSLSTERLTALYLDRRTRDDAGLSAKMQVEDCQIVAIELTAASACTALITGAFNAAYSSTDYGNDRTLAVPLAANTPILIRLSAPIHLSSCNISWVEPYVSSTITTGVSTTTAQSVTATATSAHTSAGSGPSSSGTDTPVTTGIDHSMTATTSSGTSLATTLTTGDTTTDSSGLSTGIVSTASTPPLAVADSDTALGTGATILIVLGAAIAVALVILAITVMKRFGPSTSDNKKQASASSSLQNSWASGTESV